MAICEYNDCGWCCHKNGPENGCPGWYKCAVLGAAVHDLQMLSLSENINIDVDSEMRHLLRNINNEDETKRSIEGNEEHQETDAETVCDHQEQEERKTRQNTSEGNGMKLSVENPNFSVVMPVDCNADCNFCYWEKDVGLSFERFKEVAETLPMIFEQCSITGGEPTMQKDLSKWIRVANKNFKKVVLNTNGAFLTKDLAMSVDHVNLSRHHYDELANMKIFGTATVPDASKIWELCQVTDVTLNCYLPDDFDDLTFIANYIKFAKHVGAKVAFRKNYSNLDILPVDRDDTVISQHSCGACLHRYHKIADVDVTFKYSVPETHEHTGGIYELILQANGRLTYDWAGENYFMHDPSEGWTLDGVTNPLLYEAPEQYATTFQEFEEMSISELKRQLELMKDDESSKGCHGPHHKANLILLQKKKELKKLIKGRKEKAEAERKERHPTSYDLLNKYIKSAPIASRSCGGHGCGGSIHKPLPKPSRGCGGHGCG
jgi:molybdenum cofactor biosynthesis enzyme MoaA